MDHRDRGSWPTSLDPRIRNVSLKRSEARGSGPDVRRRGSVESATGSSMSSPSPGNVMWRHLSQPYLTVFEFTESIRIHERLARHFGHSGSPQTVVKKVAAFSEFTGDSGSTSSPGGPCRFSPQPCNLCDDGQLFSSELAFCIHLTITHFQKDILDQIKSATACPKCDYKQMAVGSREQQIENMLMHVGCEDKVAIDLYKEAVDKLAKPPSRYQSRNMHLNPKDYSVYLRFGHAWFNILILGFSQFSILPQCLKKVVLVSKVVLSDKRIIISLLLSR